MVRRKLSKKGAFIMKKKYLTISVCAVIFFCAISAVAIVCTNNNTGHYNFSHDNIENIESATTNQSAQVPSSPLTTSDPYDAENVEAVSNNVQTLNKDTIEKNKQPIENNFVKNEISSQESQETNDPTFIIPGNPNTSYKLENTSFNEINSNICWKFENGLLSIKYDEKNVDLPWHKNVIDSNNCPGWHYQINFASVTSVEIDESMQGKKISLTKSWFSTAHSMGQQYSSPHIKTISGLKYLDMSEVTDTSFMFAGVGYNFPLSSIDSFNTSILEMPKLQHAAAMFSCTNNTKCGFGGEPVNITHTNTDEYKLLDCACMFQNCRDVTSINLENFDMSEVTEPYMMFSGTTSLSGTLKLGKFDFSKIKVDMSGNGDNNLGAHNMFDACRQLEVIDISQWEGTPLNQANLNEMFYSCSALTTIKVKDESIDLSSSSLQFTSNMFGERKPETYTTHSLKGCNGTTWDSNYTGKEYARVDLGYDSTGNTTPGYFTSNIPVAVIEGSAESNDLTLKFYADGALRTNTYRALSDLSSADEVPWKSNRTNISKIEFDSSYELLNSTPNMRYWFSGFTKLDIVKLPTSITDLGVRCFENCTSLKKVVVGGNLKDSVGKLIDAKLSNMEANVFDGCEKLENFVIAKIGNDTASYDPNALDGAGTSNPEIAAPLVVASGPDCALGNAYQFVSIENSNSDEGKSLQFNDNCYYYMTGDYYLPSGASTAATPQGRHYACAVPNSENNSKSVLDLNGHTLNRQAGNNPVAGGEVITILGGATLRIDSTAGLEESTMGSITGGNNDNNVDAIEQNNKWGGGIFVASYAQLDFVNGKVCNCKASIGGGVLCDSDTNDAAIYSFSNFYGGIIKENIATSTTDSNGGGGIEFRYYSRGNVYRCTIKHNQAPIWGAGICDQSPAKNGDVTGILYFSGILCKQNTLTGQGDRSKIDGGIYFLHEPKQRTDNKFIIDSCDYENYSKRYYTYDREWNPDIATLIGVSGSFTCQSSFTLPNYVNQIWDISGGDSQYHYHAVTTIGNGVNVLSGIDNVEHLTLGKNVTKIADNAFKNNTKLKSITIDDACTSIGVSAFEGCTNLEQINFGSDTTLKTIGENAFKGCKSLNNVVVPQSVVSVGENAYAQTAYMNGSPEQDDNFIYDKTVDNSKRSVLAIKNNAPAIDWHRAALASSSMTVADGGCIVARLIAGGSLSSMTNLCYFFTENYGTACISDKAFKGCTSLRTYLVKAEGDADEVSYTGQPFLGAGASVVKESTNAGSPLAIAGGNSTFTNVDATQYLASDANGSLTGTKYYYTPINKSKTDKNPDSEEFVFENNKYYFMTSDWHKSTTSLYMCVADTNSALDFNGFSLHGYESNWQALIHFSLNPSSTHKGESSGTNRSLNNLALRLDDSSNTDNSECGGITGHYNKGNADGGGISRTQGTIWCGNTKGDVVNFVNGKIYSNTARQGGAFAVDGSADGEATLNIYNGEILNCTSTATSFGGGGLLVVEGGKAYMYGGRIAGCQNTSTNGGGSAVYLNTYSYDDTYQYSRSPYFYLYGGVIGASDPSDIDSQNDDNLGSTIKINGPECGYSGATRTSHFYMYGGLVLYNKKNGTAATSSNKQGGIYQFNTYAQVTIDSSCEGNYHRSQIK